jgi:hypothetical protein
MRWSHVSLDDATNKAIFFAHLAPDSSFEENEQTLAAIPKLWGTPGIKGERIEVWLLARGRKALAVKERLRDGVLVEAGSRGASANAIFFFDRSVKRRELVAVVVSVDGQPKAFKVAPPN